MIGLVIRMLMRQRNPKSHQRNRILINSLPKDRLRVSSNQHFSSFSFLYTYHECNTEKMEEREKKEEKERVEFILIIKKVENNEYLPLLLRITTLCLM